MSTNIRLISPLSLIHVRLLPALLFYSERDKTCRQSQYIDLHEHISIYLSMRMAYADSQVCGPTTTRHGGLALLPGSKFVLHLLVLPADNGPASELSNIYLDLLVAQLDLTGGRRPGTLQARILRIEHRR